ncbi:unnamed protein product [Heterobilharzia americana]|nr:unnamed protein product [Heterobilharzia americana]
MFDLCARNVKHTIEYYILYERGDHGPVVKKCYPNNLSGVYTERIVEFAFCCNERFSVEEFVIVFTDAKGTLEFVFCYQPNEKFLLCISSKLPWCECFHSLLNILWRHGLYRDVHWSIMEPFFSHLFSTTPPHLPIDQIQCANPFNPTVGFVLRIPTPQSPHYLNYVMEYYNALDLSLWIHIFVSLLLERSLLFCSRRLTKLTACVMTAVSLLYPIQWAHSFYPLIPDKVLGVLECPVPFVAGIHICNLEKAKQYLSAGTRLVDLDMGQISVYDPPSDMLQNDQNDIELGTPKAIFSFLHHQLKEVQRQLNVSMNSKKEVTGEILNCFEKLTHPFFEMIVNLLGCYTECIIQEHSDPEVDLDALITCQSCPGLETFLKSLFESQTIQLFLDQRSRQPPDKTVDSFEYRASELRDHAKNVYQYKTSVSIAPIFTSSLSNIASNAAKCELKIGRKKINFGSPDWLRAKKLKNPGRICHTGLTDTTKRMKSESAFNWNILSKKTEQPLFSHKSNHFGSMDIHPQSTPVMSRMQDMNYSSLRGRPNSYFTHPSPTLRSETVPTGYNRSKGNRPDKHDDQDFCTNEKIGANGLLNSSSPATPQYYNSSDTDYNKRIKRNPPPRPPPPRPSNIRLNSGDNMESQSLNIKKDVLPSRNNPPVSPTRLDNVKCENFTVPSWYDKTRSLTHIRRKTCPSSDDFPPPLPPRPAPLSSKLHNRSASSVNHLERSYQKPVNGYLRNGSVNYNHQNGTSLCRPLKIPITITSQSNERGCYYRNGNGLLLSTIANIATASATPPPLPPRKPTSQMFSQLISNSNSLKSIISESNLNLMKTKVTTSDNNKSDRQLSLCERRARRFLSINDKGLQTSPLKITFPLRLPIKSDSQSSEIELFNKQGSYESISGIIKGLSIEFDKTARGTLSHSPSTIHSRSGSLSYYSATETKLDQANSSAKSSMPELLLSTKELSLGNDDDDDDDDTSNSKHRLLVRLKYATISPRRRSQSITNVPPHLTLHRVQTDSPCQRSTRLFRVKSMIDSIDSPSIAHVESHLGNGDY